ncbi:hypothetical protein SDC9_174983 [bioreactor metagenome]|uniref:Uncharacterized protein n=1 Tax=bioreactor metagenome TaxID=1076179 RepID=A0A645GNS2_9ZZZZ
MVVHVVAVGVLVLRSQADILVEVETLGAGEIEIFLVAHADEFGVDRLHGGAGGQSEDQVGPLTQLIGHETRGQVDGVLGGGLDDDFHCACLEY